MDRGAFRLRGFEPRPPAARFDILLDERQSDASALDFVARLQRLEDFPDAVLKLTRDTRSVVLNREFEELAGVACGDTNSGIPTARMLNRVRDQIQENLLQ